MGRTYIAELAVQHQIDSIIARNESVIGLIIGQVQTSLSKDFVVHLMATPAPSSDSGEESEPVTKPSPLQSLDSTDEQYVANHARQALRMLTGGFDIIGVFVCAKPEELKNAQAKLRQVIYAVHKMLSKIDSSIGAQMHGDRLLLQICALTKKLTCRTFDVTDHKSTGCPAELKFQKFIDGFVSLHTTFALDIVLPVSIDSMALSLKKQIMLGLQPVFQNVWNSLATVDDRLLADDEYLCVQPTEKKKGARRQTDAERDSKSSFTVNFLEELGPLTELSSPLLVSCGAKMHVRGSLVNKAYVHPKSTVSDAVLALKKDVIRSVIARCELLCEDLLQAEEEQDVKVLYETPLRVFASLPSNSSVELCDYLFPDETVADSSDRFRELLGISVDDEDIDAESEHMPTEDDLVKPVKAVRRLRRTTCLESAATPIQQVYKYIVVGTSVAVASLAALLSYWYTAAQDQ